MGEIWILGAAGRSGRVIAANLVAVGTPLVLVGRQEASLRAVASEIGGDARVLTLSSVEAMAVEIARSRPAVVVNTIGPFSGTTMPIARACLAGSHYVDIANDVLTFADLLGLQDEAAAAGRTLVTGAGFGVVAAESLLLKLCEGEPPAARVRVDLVPSVDSEEGQLGVALGATIVEGLVAGGRRYVGGRLVKAALGGDPERLTLPDGAVVTTGSVPFGELEIAHRVTGAPDAVCAATAAPTGAAASLIVPVASALMRIAAVRNFATHRLSSLKLKAQPRAREFSYVHARVEWASGAVREGWIQTPEGTAFTAAAAAEVARRLAQGEGRVGAYTPGVLFGPDLATGLGGQFILEPKRP